MRINPMNRDQRPHGRKKTYGTGSGKVGKGDKVGSTPVGFGGRNESNGGGSGRASGLPVNLNLKSIIILAIVVVAAIFLLKNCGGANLLSGIIDGGAGGFTDVNDSASDANATPASYSAPDLSVDEDARAKRYTPATGDDVTIMIYMCGTDLESKYGMATKDMQEMLKSKLAPNINIIIETGGCSKWQTNGISNTKNQLYKVETGALKRLNDNFNTKPMTDPANLTDFIKFCKSSYPAERNILIFWDHGGGSLTGYGYDENNKSASSMTLSKINSALANADCKFDFIGFDACLMATLETALVCDQYADYLIGSEESEPGTGWYYTTWLNKLSENTAIPTVTLAQSIIDSFVSSCASAGGGVTLSVIDLAELHGTIPSTFRDFAASTNELLKSDDYKQVSNARAGARQFAASSRINQVDLIDLAQRIDTTESKAFAKALKNCVKYNKSTISRSYGISIYFPYESTSFVKNAIQSYKDLGIDSEYSKCIQSFASLETAGQITASASQLPSLSGGGDILGSLLGSFLGGGSTTASASSSSSGSGIDLGTLTSLFGGGSSSSSSSGSGLDLGTIVSLLGGFKGRSMPEELDWVDTDLIAAQAENIANDFIDPARITATVKNGKNVLELTDDEWALVQTLELNVFVGDGEGYIDLGLDNVFEWTDDNDLLLEYDGTWLSINGNICAYYLVSDTKLDNGNWVTIGRIPAILNGQQINLEVEFSEEHEEGIIKGATPIYTDETNTNSKTDVDVNPGDEIQLLCDFYNQDGSFNASYTLGNKFTVPQSGLELRNIKVDESDISAAYRLTDIYGNRFWVAVD